MKFAVLALCAYVSMGFEVMQELVNEMIIDPQQCLQKNCGDQVQDLKKDGAYHDCKVKCGANKQCWGTCIPKMESAAAYNLAKCGQKSSCLEVPEHELQLMFESEVKCIEEKCSYEWKKWKKDLAALELCSHNCRNDEKCFQKCLAMDTTKVALQVTLCAQKNNCLPPAIEDGVNDEQCFKDHCPNEWNTIKNDPDLPDFKKCYQKCKTKKECWTFCLPSKVRKTLIDSADCATKNKCNQIPTL